MSILKELSEWNEATVEQQDDAIRSLYETKLAKSFTHVGTTVFECGKQSHRIAVFEHSATKLLFHLIPGGSVSIGAGKFMPFIERTYKTDLAEDADDLEVRVEPFLIGQYLVTEYAWEKFSGEPLFRYFGETHAIDAVDRRDVRRWAAQFGARLPTEVEWEYACKSGSNSIFYWGAKPDLEMAWTSENRSAGEYTTRTAEEQKPPNAFGLLGMIGNMGEWVEDDAYDFGDYPDFPGDDPFYDGSDADGILRGGWDNYDWGLNRSTSRIQCGVADTGCSARIVFGDLFSDHPIDHLDRKEPSIEEKVEAQKRKRLAEEKKKNASHQKLIDRLSKKELVSKQSYASKNGKPKLRAYEMRTNCFSNFLDFGKESEDPDFVRNHYIDYFKMYTPDIDRDLSLTKGDAQTLWKHYVEGQCFEGMSLIYWSFSEQLGQKF